MPEPRRSIEWPQRRVEWSRSRFPKRSWIVFTPEGRFWRWLMPKLGFLRVRRPTPAQEAFMRAIGCPSAAESRGSREPTLQFDSMKTEVADPHKTPPETPRAKASERLRKKS